MTTQYSKNYLTDVIFKIDYPIILELNSKTPELFQKKIFEKFPILEPLAQRGIKFEAQKDSKEIKTEHLEQTTWRFRNKEESILVDLHAEYLAITFKKYRSFTEFETEVKYVLDSFYEIYPSLVVNRMGLRYVNQISLPDEQDLLNWNDYINTNLVGNLSFETDTNKLRRVMQAHDIALDDNTLLRIVSGVFNNIYPNKLLNKEFVLDLDCSSLTPFDKSENYTTLKRYNEQVTAYFEKSITESFRGKLGKMTSE